MSVTYIGERNGGLTIDKDGNLSTTRILFYLVSAAESPVLVLKDVNIPARGSGHPDDPTVTLANIAISDPKEGDEVKKHKYEVTLSYARTNLTLSVDATVKPWKRKPYDIAIQPMEMNVAFQKSYQSGDMNGSPTKAVLNPAGDPYEDTTTEQNTIIRFSYNLEKFYETWIDTYGDTINQNSLTVIGQFIPERKGRIKHISGSKQYEYDSEGELQYTYWKIDVEIEKSKKKWQKDIMCRGLYALGTASTISSKYRIYCKTTGGVMTFGKQEDLGDDAIPVDEPQKLNADGTLYTSLTGAIYQTEYDKQAVNWKPLSLPSSEKDL